MVARYKIPAFAAVRRIGMTTKRAFSRGRLLNDSGPAISCLFRTVLHGIGRFDFLAARMVLGVNRLQARLGYVRVNLGS